MHKDFSTEIFRLHHLAAIQNAPLGYHFDMDEKDLLSCIVMEASVYFKTKIVGALPILLGWVRNGWPTQVKRVFVYWGLEW